MLITELTNLTKSKTLTKVTNNPHQNPNTHLIKTPKEKKKKNKPKYTKNNRECGDGPTVMVLLF